MGGYLSVDSVVRATPVGKGFQTYKPDKVFRYGQWIQIHHWTEDERDYLRRNYRYTIESLKSLALKLGVSDSSVRQQLTHLGALKLTGRWSMESQSFLETNYGKLSNRKISERLGKSVNAVTGKAHRLGITGRGKDDWFSMKEMAQILGVDQSWIRRRLGNGFKLEISPHDLEHTPKKGQYSSWHISRKSLREFIRKYPEELTGHNVDFVMLVDILAGVKV